MINERRSTRNFLVMAVLNSGLLLVGCSKNDDSLPKVSGVELVNAQEIINGYEKQYEAELVKARKFFGEALIDRNLSASEQNKVLEIYSGAEGIAITGREYAKSLEIPIEGRFVFPKEDANLYNLISGNCDRNNVYKIESALKKQGIAVHVEPRSCGAGGDCFLTTACVEAAGLPDNCYELQAMRTLRDKALLTTPSGKRIVKDYYHAAPAIVRAVNAQGAERASEIWANVRADVHKAAAFVMKGDFDNATNHYRQMTRRLQYTYL